MVKTVSTAKPATSQSKSTTVEHTNYGEQLGSAVMKYFGLGSLPCSETLKKLQAIEEYAKIGSKSNGDTMLNIKRMQNKLGLGGFEQPIDKIYNYVRMKLNKIELDKQIAALERR